MMSDPSLVGVDHVVILKFKENVTEDQVNALKDGVASLAAIDGVIAVSVGKIFVEGWMQDRRGAMKPDYVLRVRLASKEALKGYQDHPEHVKVLNVNIKPLLAEPPMAVDWESPEIST
jgi:hypothetical protein